MMTDERRPGTLEAFVRGAVIMGGIALIILAVAEHWRIDERSVPTAATPTLQSKHAVPPPGWTIRYNVVTKIYIWCTPYYCDTIAPHNSEQAAVDAAWQQFNYKPQPHKYDPNEDLGNYYEVKP